MRDYQRKKGKYVLPRTLYRMTVYQIRDYYRLKERLKDIVDEQPDPRQPHVSGGKKESNVETKSIKRERDNDVVTAIEKAKRLIPEEYRRGVWESVMYNEPYPNDAARETYSRHKSKFVYMVAKYLGWN